MNNKCKICSEEIDNSKVYTHGTLPYDQSCRCLSETYCYNCVLYNSQYCYLCHTLIYVGEPMLVQKLLPINDQKSSHSVRCLHCMYRGYCGELEKYKLAFGLIEKPTNNGNDVEKITYKYGETEYASTAIPSKLDRYIIYLFEPKVVITALYDIITSSLNGDALITRPNVVYVNNKNPIYIVFEDNQIHMLIINDGKLEQFSEDVSDPMSIHRTIERIKQCLQLHVV